MGEERKNLYEGQMTTWCWCICFTRRWKPTHVRKVFHKENLCVGIIKWHCCHTVAGVLCTWTNQAAMEMTIELHWSSWKSPWRRQSQTGQRGSNSCSWLLHLWDREDYVWVWILCVYLTYLITVPCIRSGDHCMYCDFWWSQSFRYCVCLGKPLFLWHSAHIVRNTIISILWFRRHEQQVHSRWYDYVVVPHQTIALRVVVQCVTDEHGFVGLVMESWVDAVVLKLLDVRVGSVRLLVCGILTLNTQLLKHGHRWFHHSTLHSLLLHCCDHMDGCKGEWWIVGGVGGWVWIE
jgi:hypothetical protein